MAEEPLAPAGVGAAAVLADAATKATGDGRYDALVPDHSAGGRFALSTGELEALLSRWQELADAIYADQELLRRACDAVEDPIAQDPVTGHAQGQYKISLGSVVAHSESMLKYANDYITKLGGTPRQYVDTDGANSGGIAAIGG